MVPGSEEPRRTGHRKAMDRQVSFTGLVMNVGAAP